MKPLKLMHGINSREKQVENTKKGGLLLSLSALLTWRLWAGCLFVLHEAWPLVVPYKRLMSALLGPSKGPRCQGLP